MAILLRYESHDTRHIDFSRVDGKSTDPRVLGRHKNTLIYDNCKVKWWDMS